MPFSGLNCIMMVRFMRCITGCCEKFVFRFPPYAVIDLKQQRTAVTDYNESMTHESPTTLMSSNCVPCRSVGRSAGGDVGSESAPPLSEIAASCAISFRTPF